MIPSISAFVPGQAWQAAASTVMPSTVGKGRRGRPNEAGMGYAGATRSVRVLELNGPGRPEVGPLPDPVFVWNEADWPTDHAMNVVCGRITERTDHVQTLDWYAREVVQMGRHPGSM